MSHKQASRSILALLIKFRLRNNVKPPDEIKLLLRTSLTLRCNDLKFYAVYNHQKLRNRHRMWTSTKKAEE